jgi:ureidoglycolate hydrolase
VVGPLAQLLNNIRQFLTTPQGQQAINHARRAWHHKMMRQRFEANFKEWREGK